MSRRRRPKGASGGRRRPSYEGPSLDLHGRTGDEARREVRRWLGARRAAGDRVVTVVTGRGIHSSGEAVLAGEIGHLLDVLRDDGVVEDFVQVSLGGAYRVHLHAPRTRREPSVGPRLDDNLRRRAEEALLELGIAPTPELIAAEARRIAGEER